MARKYHHGRLPETALAAATKLVDRGRPLNVRELARGLGVSHTAIRHHFRSVDAIHAALSARWFVALDRAMAATAAAVPAHRTLERFRLLGVGYVRYALAHPHRYRLLFRAGPGGLVPEADASYRRVLEAVVACAKDVDPIATTTLAWSAMHGLALLWLDGALRSRLSRAGMDALTERITALISELLVP